MEITGSVDEIIYKNEENGYTVISLDYDGDPLVCVGVFPPISEGQDIRAVGEIVNNVKYGRQFKASRIEVILPNNIDGMIRYLGSGIVYGIGPKTAMNIVNMFGEKTFDVIEKYPQRLTKVKGISITKAEELSEFFKANKATQNSIIYLQEQGITLNMAYKINKAYGEETVEIVSHNPYKLVEDIEGVGFVTADKIATKVGIKADSKYRLRAGILYALKESCEKNGNTYLPKEILLAEAKRMLGVDDESKYLESIDELIVGDNVAKNLRLKQFDLDGETVVMLLNLYRTEYSVSEKLFRLSSMSSKLTASCDKEIAEYEKLNDLTFHSQQVEAITLAVSSGISVITGGPGTGKTTIIKCILSIFESKHMTYTLLAPTGRAAKRLGESTGESASTIHRAIMRGGADSGEKFPYDVVIVDEVSMVDIFLMSMLLDKLLDGAKLILVGDKDQLPSVGAGNVLADIIGSEIIPTICLTQIYRQSEASLIITNAHAINSGLMPQLQRNDSDFFFSKASSPMEIRDRVVELVRTRLPKFLGVDSGKIQVLCPMKNGLAGNNAINKALQEAINPPSHEKKEMLVDENVFRVGDKVMHTSNNYEMKWRKFTTNNGASSYNSLYEEGEGVFNGEIGNIVDVRPSRLEIDVLFDDGKLATYEKEDLSELILAYSITVHKSQGSEFDGVVMPIVSGSYMILTRNLLYTAITRAKRLVVLVGEESNINQMVKNNYIASRYSALKYFMLQKTMLKYDI